MSRRELLGIKLRWSYAPAEVKVLTSADGGNFEEASRWRRTARTEPSFEETIMFTTPVSVKAVKVLMRGAKPWGYFGLSTVAAVAAPYSFMLVSGAAAIHEQCVVSTPAGLSAKACVDAIVAGDGHEVFGLTSAGSLQDVSGRCVALEAGKVEFRQCSNVGGVWEMTAEGQVKQGNMCLALGSPSVVAMDCEEAEAVGAGRWPCQSIKLPLECTASASLASVQPVYTRESCYPSIMAHQKNNLYTICLASPAQDPCRSPHEQPPTLLTPASLSQSHCALFFLLYG